MAQSAHQAQHQISGNASPSHSLRGGTTRPPASVETLVSYLVAAKRSLGSIPLVHRATTILSDARASIESTTALLAQTTYLRRSLASQLKVLRGIQFELEAAAQVTQIEFQSVIKELDNTDARLLQCIGLLKQTRIEEAFGAYADLEDESGVAKKTLHDFVDDKGVENIKEAMKVAIDNVQTAQHEMNQSIQTLEEDLQSVNEVLNHRVAASSTESEWQLPPIPKILSMLENNAREMAQGLESLATHFDNCVRAIKHTEGGGEAIAQTMSAEGLPDAVGTDLHTLHDPAQPISDDELIELLDVVEGDAAEVDEVVMELTDRNAEMETQLEKVSQWRERQETAYNDIATAFKLVDKIGGRLSTYVAEAARHSTRWAEERAKIEDGIGGMEELCDHYANFLHAYDGLIVEVARRKTVKKQMERVIAEAHEKLEQLYEQDRVQRLEFRNDQGEFLPSDIWQGVNSLPPRYVISRSDDDIAGGANSIPDLPRKTVEDALKRLKAGSRALP